MWLFARCCPEPIPYPFQYSGYSGSFEFMWEWSNSIHHYIGSTKIINFELIIRSIRLMFPTALYLEEKMRHINPFPLVSYPLYLKMRGRRKKPVLRVRECSQAGVLEELEFYTKFTPLFYFKWKHWRVTIVWKTTQYNTRDPWIFCANIRIPSRFRS